VLSYGYGGSLSGGFGIVSTPEEIRLSIREAGDEPAMLASKLPGVPVLVGKHRHESGLHAVREFGTDIAILDDGFQVWKLHRDLDIVLVDGTAPFDNGRMLPAGRLRETLSALRRAAL
jgi:tetraacyldisaccharide 4'-kinase